MNSSRDRFNDPKFDLPKLSDLEIYKQTNGVSNQSEAFSVQNYEVKESEESQELQINKNQNARPIINTEKVKHSRKREKRGKASEVKPNSEAEEIVALYQHKASISQQDSYKTDSKTMSRTSYDDIFAKMVKGNTQAVSAATSKINFIDDEHEVVEQLKENVKKCEVVGERKIPNKQTKIEEQQALYGIMPEDKKQNMVIGDKVFEEFSNNGEDIYIFRPILRVNAEDSDEQEQDEVIERDAPLLGIIKHSVAELLGEDFQERSANVCKGDAKEATILLSEGYMKTADYSTIEQAFMMVDKRTSKKIEDLKTSENEQKEASEIGVAMEL